MRTNCGTHYDAGSGNNDKTSEQISGSKKGGIGVLDSTLLSGPFGREILSAINKEAGKHEHE